MAVVSVEGGICSTTLRSDASCLVQAVVGSMNEVKRRTSLDVSFDGSHASMTENVLAALRNDQIAA